MNAAADEPQPAPLTPDALDADRRRTDRKDAHPSPRAARSQQQAADAVHDVRGCSTSTVIESAPRGRRHHVVVSRHAAPPRPRRDDRIVLLID
jgi:hypothetical protein